MPLAVTVLPKQSSMAGKGNTNESIFPTLRKKTRRMGHPIISGR